MKILLYLLVFILNISYIGYIFADYNNSKRVNFSQSIAYQKKSVKIYGKTIKSANIIINVGGKEYKIKSNTKGSYYLKLHTLVVGKYKVTSIVYFEKNKYYQVPREKEIILSSKYVNKMRSYYVKKIIHSNPPSSGMTKDFSLIPKEGIGKVIKKLEKPKSVINFLLLYMLLGIMSLLMLFLILRKNDLI